MENNIDIKNLVLNLKIDTQKVFGFESSMNVYGFSEKTSFVPEIDDNFVFDKLTTESILAGFVHDRRVLIQGYHGSGKSSHIEQVCARLNWPCIRVNLDSHVSRLDLVGKDAIVIEDSKQITKFKDGILPWALSNGVALVFDEYDAGRADVMFVIQRVLEDGGKLTLMDQNRVVSPHKNFRLFATANTVGLGDTTGIYHGTQQINQAQMDRWNIVSVLNYLPSEHEEAILKNKFKNLDNVTIKQIVSISQLTRKAFIAGDLSTVMSPRTNISWAQNNEIFKDLKYSFKVTFLNKCDDLEKDLVKEFYQKCFNEGL